MHKVGIEMRLHFHLIRKSIRGGRWVCLALLLIVPGLLEAVRADEAELDPILTLDRIFDGNDFDSQRFGPARWLDHRLGYTTLDDAAEPASGRDIVLHHPETGAAEILVPSRLLVPAGASDPLSIDDYTWSEDGSLLLIFTNTQKVWRDNTRGDYWVLDVAARTLQQIGGDADPSTLMFAKFSPDGAKVAYVQENNLYCEALRGGEITQLTSDGSDIVINGNFDWVYEEELSLQDGFRWSPDSASIAYWQLDTAGVRSFHLLDNTAGLYPILTTFAYPKVGDTNSAVRVGVVSAAGGETQWMVIPGDPRNHYIARMDWADNADELIVQQLNRLQNTNLVMLAEAKTGVARTILTERDDAWVEVSSELRWLDDGKKFTWLSERDGWQHLYSAPREGGKAKRLTSGEFDVVDVVGLDEAHDWVYYIASPESPLQRYLYRVGLDGHGRTRITPSDQPGTHSYQVSPDGAWAMHTYTKAGTPRRIDLVSLPEHKSMRMLSENREQRAAVEALSQQPIEFFRIDVGEGVTLDAYCIKPPAFDPTKKYPLLFHVYGEPWGQTVADRWGGNNHLWHLMLAQKGYLVMSVDNQGTKSPRGRDWRKIIYRQIGILASREQAAAARAILAERPYVDPTRIGIWGWSGGGSMTLNMLFRHPELYSMGMSVAPVPNQRYYDTIYQERYMGLPGDNTEGYRLGSPITHTAGLRGKLLLMHGTGDDNVHYQGAEALINEMIALNKPFTMMAYPNRSHSISEGENTTRHVYSLLTRYLQENLPAGARDR